MEEFSEVGTGSFSRVVYDSKQKCAIKTMLEQTKFSISVFENEQKYMHLKHPNLVEYFECSAEKLSFSLEFLKGGDMFENLHRWRQKEKGPIPNHLCSWLFVQLMKAVQFLHAHDIIHRDISLENCFLSEPLEDI